MLEKCAYESSTRQPYAAVKDELLHGHPIVMMQYMRSDANITSIETLPNSCPDECPQRSDDGQWCPLSKRADCSSSLSSIGGDLRVFPDGTGSSRGVNDDDLNHEACSSDAGSKQAAQTSVAWQGNPEYIGQGKST